jgi:hypothetical protein
MGRRLREKERVGKRGSGAWEETVSQFELKEKAEEKRQRRDAEERRDSRRRLGQADEKAR